jgi:hypothetical protein
MYDEYEDLGRKLLCLTEGNTSRRTIRLFAGSRRNHTNPHSINSVFRLLDSNRILTEWAWVTRHCTKWLRLGRRMFDYRHEPSEFCFNTSRNRANSVSTPAGTEQILFQHRQEPSGLFQQRQEPSGFCFEIDRNGPNCFDTKSRLSMGASHPMRIDARSAKRTTLLHVLSRLGINGATPSFLT